MTSKKFIVIPELNDIKFFLKYKTSKNLNYKHNEIRENILASINHIYKNYYDYYYNDPIYGEHWLNLKENIDNAIDKITEKSYDKYNIKHKGGMTNNYDYIVEFLLNNAIVDEIKIEFKYNNSKLVDIPQILELYDTDIKYKYNVCNISYSEFYYDHYLDKYLNIDKAITEKKPDKQIYLQNIFDIKYKHAFFDNMHKNKGSFIKEKRKLAGTSISEYIKLYYKTFNFDKISEKIKMSQDNKAFLLWDCNKFHVEKLIVDKLKIINIIEESINDLYFDVYVDNLIYNIRIRINWGNSAGLCNPRWKFTFIHK